LDGLAQEQDPDVRAFAAIFGDDPDVGLTAGESDGSPPATDTSGTASIESPSPDEAVQEAAPAPAQPNWDDQSNPYLQQMNQLAAAVRERKAQQEYERQQEAARERIRALADGDDVLAQQIEAAIAEQIAPYQQMAQQVEQAKFLRDKQLTAMHIALEHETDDAVRERIREHIEDLTRFDDPDQMVRTATSKKQQRDEQAKALKAKDDLIAQLQAQVAASQQVTARKAEGADATDAAVFDLVEGFQTAYQRPPTAEERMWMASGFELF
jgi:hypothetical protein